MRSRLDNFIESRTLVKICALDEMHLTVGFPVFLGENFVVMTRLFQESWENGFKAIRLDHVKDVSPIEEDEIVNVDFILRARQARGLSKTQDLPFEATTFSDFLSVVCKHYSIAVFCGKTSAGKTFGFAAHISSGDEESLRARLFKLDGYWQAKDQIVPVSEIHEVLFDSEYERTLVAMSRFGDAQ